MMNDFDSSSPIRFNIGGKKFYTTITTLTQRDPDSMLAAMFIGQRTLSHEKGYIFVDRDGKHFRHILNWLRDGFVPTLKDSEFAELIHEAEYYQLLGLIDGIHAVQNKKNDDEESESELTRTDILKCIQSEKVRFRGVNLSGLDLSKLPDSPAELGNKTYEMMGMALGGKWGRLADEEDNAANSDASTVKHLKHN